MNKITEWIKKYLLQTLFVGTVLIMLFSYIRREIIDMNKKPETFTFIDSTEFYKYVQEENIRSQNRQEQYRRLLEQSQQEVIQLIQERNSINNNRPNAQTTLDYIDRVNDANRHSVAQSIIRHLDSLNAKGSEIVRGYPGGKFKRD